MFWEDDVERTVNMLWDNLFGPGMLYNLERQFWLHLWRAPILDAIEGDEIEARRYGPVQATVIGELPHVPAFNTVLGASDPGAVQDGHLQEALDWIESKGIDCRVPIRPDFEESGAAEDHLNQRGYRRTARLARFVRDASEPGFPDPPGVEVDEWTDEREGFSGYLNPGYGIEGHFNPFFSSLPVREDWHCYVASDLANEGDAIGASVAMQHWKATQLGFAATAEAGRGRGVHMALIRRHILDGIAAGSELFFADTEEPVDDPDPPSPGAPNLMRAGFKTASVRQVWRAPK